MDDAVKELDTGSTEGGTSSVGVILARFRSERNLTLAEVSQRLKYGIRQIEALEDGDYSQLPGTTYVRGMIRSYAKLLDVDPEVVLAVLNRQPPPDKVNLNLHAIGIPFSNVNKQTTRLYRVMSVCAVGIAAALLYEWRSAELFSPMSTLTNSAVKSEQQMLTGPQKQESQIDLNGDGSASPVDDIEYNSVPKVPLVRVAEVGSPRSVSQAATPMEMGGKRIMLRFDRDSWVEIKQGDGKTLLSQLNAGGSKQLIEGTPPFLLVIGNAPNVHVFYDDQLIDLRPYFKVDVARLTLE